MLYSCITSSPLALAIRRAACVASHTAHAEACLSARQNFLATEFPVTPAQSRYNNNYIAFLLHQRPRGRDKPLGIAVTDILRLSGECSISMVTS